MRKFWEKIGTTEIRNILAVISIIGAYLIVYLLIIKPIPEGNKDTVNQAIGFVLGSAVSGVIGYFFGASKANVDNKP